MNRLLWALLALVLLLAACGDEAAPRAETPATETPAQETIPFRKDGTLDLLREGEPYLTLEIEIAADDSSRTRGLMQRTSLPDKSGMLFLFDFEDDIGFWMGNTLIGLDLIFIDADSQIVDIHKYAAPLSPETIATDVPAQYVLEVVAGFTDSNGIAEGDRVRWRRE